jgi:hypothetical protein
VATFSSTGNMTQTRSGASAQLLGNGEVLVAGGFGDDSSYLTSAELYDPATGTFGATGSMTNQRNNASASGLVSGK